MFNRTCQRSNSSGYLREVNGFLLNSNCVCVATSSTNNAYNKPQSRLY